MDLKKIIIAIDGYSSCGKSTVAKELATKLKYVFIDTGAMYRCATLIALRNNLITENGIDEEKLTAILKAANIKFQFNERLLKSDTYLNNELVEKEIRNLDVSNNVSNISKIKSVRVHLVALQQKMGKDKGIVMDGRDIGTVVFPNAELKIFMTADVDVRTRRRYQELIGKGEKITYEEVKENLQARDLIDSTRAESPLKKADDAIILDNSFMTPQEQLNWILEKAEKILN